MIPRFHHIALAMIGGLAVGSAAAQAPTYGDRDSSETGRVGAALETLLTTLHRRGWFDGAVVAGRGDSILYARGFGYADVANRVPFTQHTASDGGSLAKTFTAAAIWMLAEAGALSLNDPVERFLPAYPYPGTTLGHLLTHRTGGLPDYDYFWEHIRPDSSLTNERLLEVLSATHPPLRHAPGRRFVYDSPAFDLAALVIEHASGVPYATFLRERIARPLGIDEQSLFVRPARFADWPGRRTMSYRRERDSLVVFDVWDGEGFHGGSNIYLSADALYRWVTSFYTRPVLSPPTLAMGLGPVLLADGSATGINHIGWYADEGRTRFEYPGVLQGFHSVGYWDAGRGHSFGLVSNSNIPQRLRPVLVQAIAAILTTGQPVTIDLEQRDEIGEGYEAAAGSYHSETLGTVEITLEEGAPYVRLSGGPSYRMYRVEPTTLYVPGLDAWITFQGAESVGFRILHWTTPFTTAVGTRAGS